MLNKKCRRAFDTVEANVSKRSLLEQLAEECSELAQASIKMIRASECDDNPTIFTSEQMLSMMKEEITDVLLVADLLGITAEREVYEKKLVRWAGRLDDDEESKE